MKGSPDHAFLTNVHVAVTGMAREQRQQVQGAIEDGGGTFTPNLSRRCTHLVVPDEAAPSASLKMYLAQVCAWSASQAGHPKGCSPAMPLLPAVRQQTRQVVTAAPPGSGGWRCMLLVCA